MTRRRVSLCARCTFLLWSFAAYPLGAPAQTAGDQLERSIPRVLVIYSDNRLLPANVLFDENLREALASGTGGQSACTGEFLDEVRFPDRYEERMRDLLLRKYGGSPADVIVAFASPSLDFCLRSRSQLFPKTPIVFAGPGTDTVGGATLEPGITGIRSSFDALATLNLALRLHPRTQHVYLITPRAGFGTDSSGTGWAHLRASESSIPIHYLTAQSLRQLMLDLSELPENCVVLNLAGIRSGGDDLISPMEVMRRVSEVSPAPIYGISDPFVGYGLVGAVTTPVDTIGRATAALVLDVLSRKDPTRLPAIRSLSAVTLVDWRQLRRWGVRNNQLPPGAVVRFEPPSFWRQHLLLVVTASLLFLLQSGLILSLVLQSRRRRKAELEALRRREELAHMTRVATMGELTASLAHEINQPLTAILSNAQAAQRLLTTGDANRDEILEILSDIATDDQRAGEVIRRMRTLLRKGESTPAEIDVNELVSEVIGLVHGEIILQDASLVLELTPRRLLVHGDRVQLQQVLLNLVMNALDSMKGISGGSRRIVVGAKAVARDRSVEISVQDNGVGVKEEMLEKIFEPFYTTKPHGLGLGLAICRSIIQTHGGRIGSRNPSGRGTIFWFTLPTLEEAKS